MKSRLKYFLLSFLSAGLLILAYPKTDLFFLAWIAFVPLLFVLDQCKSYRASFGYSFLTGFLFFFGTMAWLFQLSRFWPWPLVVFAILLLFCYLGLYFGVFGIAYHFSKRLIWWKRVLFCSSVWVGLEFIRGHFLSGFDWCLLGHSQYQVYPLNQLASLTSVYGLSFLLICFNFCFLFLKSSRQKFMAFTLLLGIAFYGIFVQTINSSSSDLSNSLTVSLIQPNIDQADKFNPDQWLNVFQKTIDLTFEAVKEKPDVIVWPETSLPGVNRLDSPYMNHVRKLAIDLQTPIILGLTTQEESGYFNAVVLINDRGEIESKYDKQHLVPFGEYLPGRRSWLKPFAKWIPVEDLTFGQRDDVFRVQDLNILPLICFEDTVARLVRKRLNLSPGVLLNVTNDAWFGDSRAPLLHLQSSIFRSIENRRAMIRAANNGASCLIDSNGKIVSCLENKNGKRVNVAGVKTVSVSSSSEATFYSKYGDIFALICFLFFSIVFVVETCQSKI